MALSSSTQSALSWVIVGRGAIGLLAAARLQQAGYTATLWLKQPDAVQLKFTDLKQQSQHRILRPQPTDTAIQRVLVPVKAYDVLNAVAQLVPFLANDAQLVISHNGIIPIEPLLALLRPAQGLWFLSTSQAAYKPAAHHVVHTGEGKSYITKLTASDSDDNQTIAAMSAALGPVNVVSDIYPMRWLKLAVNAAINPLTAIENCQNGQLAQPQYRAQISALTTEVCQVAAALGYPMDPANTLQTVYQVISATSDNFSSMQQDIQAGRQTEIVAICGYICQQAAQLQLAVPANQQMLNQILAKTTTS
ncbi:MULTISPECIES: ketopantoate reductase family protein [unclassified Arsukibacterium]|uniref:ketopantoate reductase family protein n=1 Tax=unclassified Arsukibacterium TaxID=2635278 RepID=UPI000C9364F0|nr:MULTISPECIES: 2-dehydropantoate 2-reductase [unclassified Arsukibacterium]MAA93037.1 2-dehydropantoate 2-reductase [Rheinheimera sp.]HAW93848.1 2-dehydropantoate 2-reductase [Candidatus Azambacteria bacterium]|tara:strand:+ start:33371 stop:34288 length:918 start_codon:yes stop_codon:yes gene_type:complete